MKNDKERMIRINGSDYTVLPSGAIKVNNCDGRYIGQVSPSMLDKVVARAEAAVNAPDIIRFGSDNYTITYEDDGTVSFNSDDRTFSLRELKLLQRASKAKRAK